MSNNGNGLGDGDLFDLIRGLQKKDEGMALAAEHKAELLEIARGWCREHAAKGPPYEATADVAAFRFVDNGLPGSILGNAAGSLFKGQPEWRDTGRMEASSRVSNHAHRNIVWLLVF